jgi:hypothetical protein
MWVPNDRNLYRLLTDWGGVIAGILALAAAWWTVRATREDANRAISAAHGQTAATAKQTAEAVRLNQERIENEDRSFRVMLEAAMARVLAETASAKKAYPQILTQTADASAEAYLVRTCITKGAFAELRAACVRLGSPLTADFLDLEREIDSFASQWVETGKFMVGQPPGIRVGKHAGMGEQFAVIEAKAIALRKKAAETAALNQ